MLFLYCFILYLVTVASKNVISDAKINSDQENGQLANDGTLVISQNRVKVEVYMESHCPITDRYFKNQLVPVYEELQPYIELALYPSAHANWTRMGTTEEDYFSECHHGPKECLVNQQMNCGIDRLKTVEKYFPYIVCLQMSIPNSQKQVECDEKAGLSHSEMQDCGFGREGRLLFHKMGQFTKLQHPDTDYLPPVPYVVVDGIRNENASVELKNVVCETLNSKFGLKPNPCSAIIVVPMTTEKPAGSNASRHEKVFYAIVFNLIMSYFMRW